MTKLPIKYVILEGPDCSGKSSLYSTLNKATQFKRNIKDRSFLSTLCYARLYDRNDVVEDLRDRLYEELCDINNYLIVLFPSVETLSQRLSSRGDDYQDRESLMKLRSIYEEELINLERLPNVMIVREDLDIMSLTDRCCKNILQYEQLTPAVLGSLTRMWTRLSKNSEVQARIRLILDPHFSDEAVMDVEHEKEYYEEIMSQCNEIVRKEVAGENIYGIPQDLSSRRFYYSSDTCISSIHFLNRGSRLKVIVTLRSTDSIKNGSADLRYLCHLSTSVARTNAWSPTRVELFVNYNSLHVREAV